MKSSVIGKNLCQGKPGVFLAVPVLVFLLSAGMTPCGFAQGRAGKRTPQPPAAAAPAAAPESTGEPAVSPAGNSGTSGPDSAPAGEEELSSKSDNSRRRSERDEELPAEFQPEKLIPWHPSQVELPDWREKDFEEIRSHLRPGNQGGGLFPPELWPLQPEPSSGRDSPWPEAQGTESGGSETEGGKAQPVAGPLSPELAAAYFGQKPDRVLLDPQHLLKPGPAGELESLIRRWLNEDCVFKTTVLLFAPGQELPPELNPAALAESWFGGEPDRLLIFYFYQEPDRAKAVFAPGAARRFPAEQLSEAMLAVFREAARAEGELEQMERFCYKSAIRLRRLSKFRPHAEAAPAGPDSREAHGRVWTWGALGVLAAAGVFWLRSAFRKKRGSQPEAPPVLLPDQELYPRLGAGHCGGFSSVLTFPAPPNAVRPPGR